METDSQKLDAGDQLSNFRSKFHIPTDDQGQDVAYFCGHSLGLQPKTTRQNVERELDVWRDLAVRGHAEAAEPWIPYHELAAPALAELLGCQTSEVVAMNSLTTNLHLLMVSFYRPFGKRTKILIEEGAFPSDRFACQSQLQCHGYDPKTHLLEIPATPETRLISDEAIAEVFAQHGDEIALVVIGGVQYATGQVLNMAEICRLAVDHGCRIGLDLAHACGNVAIDLGKWQPDFAVWCHYKYLNSGPGAIGGAFVAERHHRDSELPRFGGWWGHNKAERFKMTGEFEPIKTAEGWQLSNPPIISLASVRASLDLFQAATLPALVAKSTKLTGFLREILQTEFADDITILTPNPAGCQLSVRLQGGRNAEAIADQLAKRGVIVDFRHPDILRIAPVPLYNCFQDVTRFGTTLREVLNGQG